MDKMVVVFDSERTASEGAGALATLDESASLTVYAVAVIAKQADGSIAVRQASDQGSRDAVLI